ncbi:MutS-related protein [Mucilaginibacter sp. UYCu711]|uniref:MutS-related protein n=1 Tax=Mucilaginibacter sp. UYCu711 TaxID=3156339 RepID=UPI003D260B90
MSFIADKQTLDDLNLTGRYKQDSIFNLFNGVKTTGGEKLLEKMFRQPLADPEQMNLRTRIFKYFQGKALTFPAGRQEFDVMENYISGGTPNPNLIFAGTGNLRKLVLAAAIKDEQYVTMQTGILATIAILKSFALFIDEFDDKDNPYAQQLQIAKAFFNDNRLNWLSWEDAKKLSFSKTTFYDHLLRHTLQKEMQVLINIIYHIDVYIAVAGIAEEKNFTYATALPKQSNLIKAEGLYHPSLKNAVSNTLSLHQQSNLLFLTGANMAGKSTLMKTFGVAMYLAHLGFPVAAKQMEFSIMDGIYSSINVPDDLSMGYSHFYAEVLRVKTVAEEVSNGKDMVVIFDELFKGTNVKDAFDATLAVTEEFSAYKNCFFIISTHIIEVGDKLMEKENVQFGYMPTLMDGNVPTYPYTMSEGITTDRQGMIIIENEGILEILNSASTIPN